eukprot:ANDGO_03366.mRNA.1 hypothetical protein
MLQYRILDADDGSMAAVDYFYIEKFKQGSFFHVFEVDIDDGFDVGKYNLEAKVCEGACEFTATPHTYVYDIKIVPIVIDNSK